MIPDNRRHDAPTPALLAQVPLGPHTTAVLAAVRRLAASEGATHGPIAAATGLKKATVDAAVLALAARQLVEIDLDGPRRHRRPRALRAATQEIGR